jgi:hypothetical protein
MTSVTPIPYAFCYAFSCTLFLLVVVERVCNACATLLSGLFWGRGTDSAHGEGDVLGTVLSFVKDKHGFLEKDFYDDPRAYSALQIYSTPSSQMQAGIKGYASMQMVGSGFTFFAAVGASLADSFVSAITALSVYMVWAFFTTLVFSLLFVLQENYSDVLIDAVDQYNSTYGPFLHKVVFIPLQVEHTQSHTHTHTHNHTKAPAPLCLLCIAAMRASECVRVCATTQTKIQHAGR